MKWVVVLVIVLGLAGVAGYAGWKQYQSKKAWDRVRAERAVEEQREAAKWRKQLDALARLRPMFSEADSRYPEKVAAARKCPDTVQGDTFFFDRWRIRGLMKNEEPPKSDLEESDFAKMESRPFWVVYFVEREARTVINGDGTMVPGSSSGSVVVFDVKTRQPLCESPVASRGSSKLEFMAKKGDTSAAADWAQRDLRWQFNHAVGDVLGQIAPKLHRTVGFFR